VDPDAAVLIVPALLYLMLSGRVNELKGPAGPEVRLSEIANQTIPVPGKDSPAGTLAYEELREVETGRRESFLARIRDITPEESVILTLTLGSDSIDGSAAANHANGADAVPALQVRRHPRLARARAPHLYMEEHSFRHLIEADVIDAQELLNNIEERTSAPYGRFPAWSSAR
jgi:hypothetical protein